MRAQERCCVSRLPQRTSETRSFRKFSSRRQAGPTLSSRPRCLVPAIVEKNGVGTSTRVVRRADPDMEAPFPVGRKKGLFLYRAPTRRPVTDTGISARYRNRGSLQLRLGGVDRFPGPGEVGLQIGLSCGLAASGPPWRGCCRKVRPGHSGSPARSRACMVLPGAPIRLHAHCSFRT